MAEKIDTNVVQRRKNNRSKDHGRNTSRSAQRIISGVVPVFQECGEIRDSNGHDIQNDKVSSSKTIEYLLKRELNILAEEEQGKHVEKQVREILVNKARRQKSVIFISCGNEVRIHDHTTDSGRIVERKKTDQNGETNY